VKIKIGAEPAGQQRVPTPERVWRTACGLMAPGQREHFQRELELDFAISEGGLGRFRANVFMQRGARERILNMFPGASPVQAARDISQCLRAVPAQRLLMGSTTGASRRWR
jgi:Tfp pilus assembly ATPase PilU